MKETLYFFAQYYCAEEFLRTKYLQEQNVICPII